MEGEASLQDGKEIRLAPCRMRVTVELVKAFISDFGLYYRDTVWNGVD